MKNYTYIYRIQAIVLVCSLLFAGVFLSSCKDDEEKGTSEVTIISFGPSQLLAGEELKFIGTNLDQVSTVVLPGGVEITDFASKSKSVITIVLPEGIADGAVTLKSSQGDIVTSTPLGVGRPIEVNSFTPATAKPGTEITLTGNFLNLVGEVIFSNGKSVTDFVSKSQTALKVVVPRDAQTGIVSVIYTPTESWKDPEEVESDVELVLSLPAVTSLSPASVKPGTTLTLTGTNLDLTDKVLFVGGGSSVLAADFNTVTATSLSLTVPNNAENGTLVLTAPSFLEVETSAISIVQPTISGVSPASVNMNEDLTISGTNLDLVTSVSFADGSSVDSVDFVSNTADQIVVTVTATATDGSVTLNQASSVTIESSAVAIIKPTITGGLPATVATLNGPETITLTGTGFDDIASAAFTGVDAIDQWAANVTIQSDTQLTIEVTQGSISGVVTLIATNGETIASTASLTIVPDVPVITSINAEVFVGGIVTIVGTNLNVLADVYFPGDVQAVTFASKSATLLEVIVPGLVPEGAGSITFKTYAKEIFDTPSIDFKLPGVEPIADGSLIIFDFDEQDDGANHNLGWDTWGGAFAEQSGDPGPGIADNNRFAVGNDVSIDSDWLIGCNHDGLFKHGPVAKDDYELKMDVFIPAALDNADFDFQFDGTQFNIGNIAATATPSWTTITIDISGIAAIPASINPDGAQANTWGLRSVGAVNPNGIKIDNIRFSPK